MGKEITSEHAESKSSIKEVVIKGGLQNTPIKTSKKHQIPIPDGLFKLPTIAAFIAHKGSGKTNAAILLAKEYQQFKSLNTVYVISPTFESNDEFNVLDIDDSNVYTNIDTVVQDLLAIQDKIKDAAELYKLYIHYKKIYDKWKQIQAQWDPENIHKKIPILSTSELLFLEEHDYKPPPHMDKPRPLIILDDLSHSAIYTGAHSNPFNNLALRHRHIGGKGYGVTIFMMVQTFKTGIPRALRQGAVQQFFIWHTHDSSNLKEMYDAIANCCTFEQFMEMYKIATAESHHFLTVDPYESDKTKIFRKDFNVFLIPPKIES